MNALEALYRRSPVFVQTAMLNAKAVELYLERYGRKFRRLAEAFERQQWWSPSDLQAYQDERLREIVRSAYDTVPYYRDVMRAAGLTPDDVKTRADLPKLPI